MVGVARVAGLLAKGTGVDFEIALARPEELADELAAGDVWRHGEKLLDILVEVLAAAVGDSICNVGDGAWHEGECAWASSVAGFVFELR